MGTLVLHLAGNVRQLIGSELGGAPDAAAVLAGQTAAGWSQPRSFRGQPATALGLAVRSAAHFRGHTQEIIHLTRTLLGNAYRFAGPPPDGPPR